MRYSTVYAKIQNRRLPDANFLRNEFTSPQLAAKKSVEGVMDRMKHFFQETVSARNRGMASSPTPKKTPR